MIKSEIPYQVWWNSIVPFNVYNPPMLIKQSISFKNKKFISINEISRLKNKNHKDYILLFFAEDKHFNGYYTKLWQNNRIEILQSFYAVCGLDFSTFPYGDEEENKHAIKKNRMFCTFCQHTDILCIYNVIWTGKESYDIAFNNVAQKSVVIVSTYRIMGNDDKIFREGYIEMKKRINPCLILCYGRLQSIMSEDYRLGLVMQIPTRFDGVKQIVKNNSLVIQKELPYIA